MKVVSVFGFQNNRVMIAIVGAIAIFLFWLEPDQTIKLGGIGVFVLFVLFGGKIPIPGFNKSSGGFSGEEYSPDDLATNQEIKEDLVRELELNSHEPISLSGYTIEIKSKQVRPPVFIYQIRKKGADRLVGIGNALKDAKERMITSPTEFDRLGMYYGERNIYDVILKVWPSKKELQNKEFEEKLIQRLRNTKQEVVT